MRTIRTSLLFLALGLPLGGCHPNMAPVYTPQSAVMAPSGKPATTEQVEQAIIRACALKTWTVSANAGGTITASVRAGGHSATVQIRYNAGGWVIEHQESSEGLKFDGEIIHRRYNNWINLLDAAIKKELMTPTMMPTAPAAAAAAPAAEAAAPAEAPPAAEAAAPAEAPPAADAPPPSGPEPDPSWNNE